MVQWEYEVGPLKLNFRVLLEPKGFLRIIIAFIAILAFSITAGFSSSGTNNTISCQGNPSGSGSLLDNFTATITYQYPYDGDNFQIDIGNNFFNNTGNCQENAVFSRQTFYGSAQYYVAMGVFTMLYVIGALIIYVMFITPDLFMAKYLVIVDLFFTIGFGVFYLLACIAWSAGVAQLNSYVAGRLEFYATNCFQCDNVRDTGTGSLQNFAQPAISLIFGWLATFVWFASIWFVYKDTFWHKDRTGPLAKLYQPKEEGQGGGGGGQDEGTQRSDSQ